MESKHAWALHLQICKFFIDINNSFGSSMVLISSVDFRIILNLLHQTVTCSASTTYDWKFFLLINVAMDHTIKVLVPWVHTSSHYILNMLQQILLISWSLNTKSMHVHGWDYWCQCNVGSHPTIEVLYLLTWESFSTVCTPNQLVYGD